MTSSSSQQEVRLYRYDLSNGMASQFAPMLIGQPLEGIWHTSIVAFGCEYYFDGGVGIERGPPGQTRFGVPKRSESLGRTSKSQTEFETWNRAMMSSNQYGPNSYNLLQRNCNHYSQDACRFLTGGDIAADVREMIPTLLATPFGAMVRPMLEQMSMDPNPHASPLLGGAGGGLAAPTAPQPHHHSSGGHVLGGGASSVLSSAAREEAEIQLALIATDDTHTAEQRADCTTALTRIFGNICAAPENPQYKRISRQSEFYGSRIAPFPPAAELLIASGFVPDGETHLVFKGSASTAAGYLDVLRHAQS